MPGLRRRAVSILALLAVFALCVSTQHGPVVSAKDKAKAIAAADNDAGSTSAATAEGEDKPVKAKTKASSTKKKARPETSKKKKGSSNDSDSSPGTSTNGNGSGAGSPGGLGSGSAGNSNADNTRGTPGQSPQATGAGSGKTKSASTRANATRGAGQVGAQAAGPGQQGPDPALVKKVIDIQERNHAAVAGQKGVVGTCTGLDDDGNVVIKVYTTGADNPKIPKSFEGVDVLEVLTGPMHKFQSTVPQRQQRLGRPVPIGTTAFCDTDLSATSCAAGTLSCRLRDNHGNFYCLSNNHVFAGVNGTQGKDPNGLPPEIPVPGPFQIPGTNLVQPAPGDDNCVIGVTSDVIGVLVAFVFIVTDGTTINFVDCAMGKTNPQLVNTSTLADGYGVPTSKTVLPFLGQKVQKYGRTSGYTTGTVTGINGIALIDFDGPLALFAREIEVTATSPSIFPSFGVPGDSGSLVVDMNRNPVALLHAGGGGITLCNPIRLVLEFLADELMAHPGLPQDIVLTIDDSKPTQVGKEARANPTPVNLP
jgi:hypothetical protein